MPNHESGATLRAVFTFYSDIVTLTSEGDSVVSDETLQGLGTTASSLIQTLFGSLLRLASPHDRNSSAINRDSSPNPPSSPDTLVSPDDDRPRAKASISPSTPSLPTEAVDAAMEASSHQPYATAATAAPKSIRSATLPGPESTEAHGTVETESGLSHKGLSLKRLLIKYLPDPGYFVAGAVAGGISRTATAPLDRLKVYLLVNTTNTTSSALDAAKKGRPVLAIKSGGRSFAAAVADLYKSGGLRGFFAGMLLLTDKMGFPSR